MITDKGMQARPTDKDQWLIQPFRRGAGVFIGRITPAGERLFYFRYTDSTGKRPFLPIVFSVNQGEKSASIKVRRMAGVGAWRA